MNSVVDVRYGALLHQQSSPAVCSIGDQEILVALSTCELGGGDGPRITSSCHCSSTISEAGGPGFSACRAEECELQRLIASGGKVLQLPENVATAPFGIGNQPGQDLLPLPFKRVFVGAPPAQHAFYTLMIYIEDIQQ